MEGVRGDEIIKKEEATMREVVLDTETTGLNPTTGDRIIEIGCVELIDHLPTGRIFQTFVDPERPNDKIARRHNRHYR